MPLIIRLPMKYGPWALYSLSLFLVVTFNLLAVTPSYAQESTCQNFPVGHFKMHEGTLVGSQGTIVDLDGMPLREGTASRMTVSDIRSGRSFVVSWKNQKMLPVARDNAFSKILFRGYETDTRRLFLYSGTGTLLEKLSMPVLDNDPSLTQHYSFVFDEGLENIRVSSPKNILTYSLKAKRWETIYSVPNGAGDLGWFNFNSEYVNALFIGDRVIFTETFKDENGGLPKYRYTALDIATKQRLFEVLTSSFFSRLIGGRVLAFDERPQVKVWDFFSGQTTVINLEESYEKLFNMELFEGPLDSVGISLPSLGRILFYSSTGSLQKKVSIPLSEKIKSIDGGRRLSLSGGEGAGAMVFDTRSGVMMPWPNLLVGSIGAGTKFLWKKKLYIKKYMAIDGPGGILEVDLTSRCLNPEEVTSLLASPVNTTDPSQGRRIGSILALEGIVPGLDREAYIQSLHHQPLSMPETKSFLGLMIESMGEATTSRDGWRWYLSFMQPSLTSLSKTEKESLMDLVAITVSEQARKNFAFQEVSTSKMANIVLEMIKPFFGEESKGRTDFSLRQIGSSAEPIVLATGPIDQDPGTKTSFGFYAKTLDTITVGTDTPTHFDLQWTHNNKKWRVQGSAKTVSLQGLINKNSAPPYEKLWADHQLVGAFILSSNLVDGFENLARRILEYYRGQGFSFGVPKIKAPENSPSVLFTLQNLYLFPFAAKQVNDPKAWLGEKIASGEIDYWVKEAHAGGSDEVIWLAKNNELLEGSKTLANGQTEKVYILYPKELDPKMGGHEIPIRDQDYANWFKARERNRGNDLVYINASCWSDSRAKQELIAARSPLLHQIATTASTSTFANKVENHERLVIDSLRHGKSYQQMRDGLEAIKGSANPFIFPSDSEYESRIWNNLQNALDYNFELSAEAER